MTRQANGERVNRKNQETTTIHVIFGLLALVSLLAHLRSRSPAALAITAALISTLWWCAAKGETGREELVAAAGLLLLNAAGVAFSLYPRAWAGVTYDTYMHLLAGYVVTMLLAGLLRRRGAASPLLKAGLVTFTLGLLLEGVELAERVMLGSGFPEGWRCAYWQETAKDLVNDALGILLFALAARVGKRKENKGVRRKSPSRRSPSRGDSALRRAFMNSAN